MTTKEIIDYVCLLGVLPQLFQTTSRSLHYLFVSGVKRAASSLQTLHWHYLHHGVLSGNMGITTVNI